MSKFYSSFNRFRITLNVSWIFFSSFFFKFCISNIHNCWLAFFFEEASFFFLRAYRKTESIIKRAILIERNGLKFLTRSRGYVQHILWRCLFDLCSNFRSFWSRSAGAPAVFLPPSKEKLGEKRSYSYDCFSNQIFYRRIYGRVAFCLMVWQSKSRKWMIMQPVILQTQQDTSLDKAVAICCCR